MLTILVDWMYSLGLRGLIMSDYGCNWWCSEVLLMPRGVVGSGPLGSELFLLTPQRHNSTSGGLVHHPSSRLSLLLGSDARVDAVLFGPCRCVRNTRILLVLGLGLLCGLGLVLVGHRFVVLSGTVMLQLSKLLIL